MIYQKKNCIIWFEESNEGLRHEIYLCIYIILSIYKSCDWINFFHWMVIEIVWNNEIQMFFFSNQFIFLKKNMFVYIIGKKI
jgi:hypothetical protein